MTFYSVRTWFISSIPIARSTIFRRWFVKNRRLLLYSDPVFDPVLYFEVPKALLKYAKKKGFLWPFLVKGSLAHAMDSGKFLLQSFS